MFKLAIVLCCVLFASTAHSAYWSDALEAVQQKAGETINATITEVEDRLKATQERAEEIAKELLNKANELKEQIQNEIKEALKETQNEIDKFTGKAEGVEVTQCTEWAAHLEYTAYAVIANVTKCITDKVETGAGYVQSMLKITSDVLFGLTEISNEAYHCSDNVQGVKSATVAIVCTNVAAAKAAWVSAKVVPSMAVKVTKLNLMLATLQPSLSYCAASNGLITFYHESWTAVQNTKKCVQQKIDEAHAIATPEIHHGNEENDA